MSDRNFIKIDDYIDGHPSQNTSSELLEFSDRLKGLLPKLKLEKINLMTDLKDKKEKENE